MTIAFIGLIEFYSGQVAEWSKALVLKTSVGQPTVGSNPTLPAIFTPKIMIKNIISTVDFLLHDESNTRTNHLWIINLFSGLIEKSTNIKILKLSDVGFDRNKFFKLSGITNIAKSYNQCDKSAISNESIEYLKQFINDKTLVMGVEIGADLRSIFTSLNINFINFWIGSYKLFDDLILMINTNNKDIFDKIQAYKVHEEQLYLFANYWKIRINESKVFNDSRLKENSVLFAGQTLKDQAIEKDGVYLNILNFKERLKELSQTYEKVYYAPHPSAEYSAEIEKYIANSKFIEKLSDIPTYYLLASSKITKVIGISSSVLYEARFFKKRY